MPTLLSPAKTSTIPKLGRIVNFHHSMATAQPRILILRFSSLGDVVLASSLFDGVRVEFPTASLVFTTKESFAPLFAHDPRLSAVEALAPGPGGFRDLWRRLERFEPDAIVDAHASLRSLALVALLPPVPVRRIAKDSWQRLAFVYLRLRSEALQRHQLDRLAALLEKGTPRPPRLHLHPPTIAAATARLGNEAWIAVAPGARHATKQWDAARFAHTTRELCKRHGARALVVGSPAERELCAQVAMAIGAAALDLSGQLRLDELAAHLAACRLLLCNDSGLLHVAEAVGTPVLALFGPTSREFGFYPVLPQSRVVEHALPCRPCSRTGARACHMPERWCMTRSTADLVGSQLELQWQRLDRASSI